MSFLFAPNDSNSRYGRPRPPFAFRYARSIHAARATNRIKLEWTARTATCNTPAPRPSIEIPARLFRPRERSPESRLSSRFGVSAGRIPNGNAAIWPHKTHFGREPTRRDRCMAVGAVAPLQFSPEKFPDNREFNRDLDPDLDNWPRVHRAKLLISSHLLAQMHRNSTRRNREGTGNPLSCSAPSRRRGIMTSNAVNCPFSRTSQQRRFRNGYLRSTSPSRCIYCTT